jgi:diguanylate cyclase (GGDEF)-like protein
MTLYRQLLIFTLVLFSILFACTWLVKLQNTRVFLEDQLESHAQDTATSLGLSISPYVAEDDMAMVETMINAVFDRGYYRTIVMTNLDGATLIDQTLEVTITDIPSWFVKAVPLKIPGASTLVTAGWKQMGSLYVESHPGYAYKTLWTAISKMTMVFGLIGGLALALGAIGLRILLLPLQRIEKQAEELCNKHYTFQAKLPRTRELRRVVTAMNSMTEKVKQMFDEQAQVADRLRKHVYSDVLTGLGNRRYLQGQVAARMHRRDASIKGAFLLAQVCNIVEINQEKGYQHADQILRMVADSIREVTSSFKNAALARISGGTFALFLPDAAEEDARLVAIEIARSFGSMGEGEIGVSENIGHIGGVSYDHAVTLNQLLSEADRIVTAAQRQGANCWIVESLSSDLAGSPRGEQEWKQVLDEVLKGKTITLVGQAVFMKDNLDQPIHIELLSRITLATGQMMSAGLFIPMAERLRRMPFFDRIVLEKAMLLDIQKTHAPELAVNISSSSLKDKDFVDWVISSLRQMPAESPAIIFEFAEFNAVQQIEILQEFSRTVRGLGHCIALDHFGQSLTNFGYLKSLQPKYVKIDRAFTDELKAENSDSHFFIGSLVSVAHSLDILAIAEGVETEQQYRALCELNIDGIQGYYVGKPGSL